jgi:predicted O-methyltransferase YrrM
MLSRIKNKVKQHDYRLADLHQLQEDQLALAQIYKMFPDAMFLPLTTWTISPRAIVHICNEIVMNHRKTIVEFGSGFSTICVAQLLKLHGRNATFITVEEDAVWAAELAKILDGFGLKSYVTIVTAPVTDIRLPIAKSGQTKWYDTDVLSAAFLSVSNIDMVVVDGPTGAVSKHARYSAIPFLKDRLSDDFVIFVDDTFRTEERDMAADWKELLNTNWRAFKRYTYLFSAERLDTEPYGVKFKK